MEGNHKPWWQDDPELKEILRRGFEEFEQELEQRAPAGPDEDEAAVRQRGTDCPRRGTLVGRDR